MSGNENIEKEINVLCAGKEIEINGECVKIKPLNWLNGLQAVKPLTVLVGALVQNADSLQETIQNLSDEKQDLKTKVQIFTELISDVNVEELVASLSKLMMLGSGKNQSYIEGLLVDDAVKLGLAIYEVNKDFFGQRLMKKESGEKVQ